MKWKLYAKKIVPTEEELEEYRISEEDHKWLNTLPRSELKKYFGKYVAVSNKEIVATVRRYATLKELYDKIDEKKIKISFIRKYLEGITIICKNSH
ncbi:MAG: DUF5678 domain-containing protein [Methanosarcinales archaeon]